MKIKQEQKAKEKGGSINIYAGLHPGHKTSDVGFLSKRISAVSASREEKSRSKDTGLGFMNGQKAKTQTGVNKVGISRTELPSRQRNSKLASSRDLVPAKHRDRTLILE